MFTNLDDFSKLGKDNMDLALKSFSAMSRGLQAIAVEVADHSKKSFEDGSAAVQQLMGVKTLDKAVEVQASFAKGSYEAFVARATKIGELAADTAKESFRPYEGALSRTAAAVK